MIKPRFSKGQIFGIVASPNRLKWRFRYDFTHHHPDATLLMVGHHTETHIRVGFNREFQFIHFGNL